jgi:hypothetical protein
MKPNMDRCLVICKLLVICKVEAAIGEAEVGWNLTWTGFW